MPGEFDSAAFDAGYEAADGSTATEGLEVSSTPEVVGEAGEPAATESQVFDWTPYVDHNVTVKVRGEDLQVPFKEALAGYQRNADYTQGKQELSARQKDLDSWDALNNAFNIDPQKALLQMAQDLGIPLGIVEAAAAATTPVVNPVEQSVQDIQKQLNALQLEREVGRLESTYGDDFVFEDVAKFAMSRNIASLDDAFQIMQVPKLQAKLAEQAVAEKFATEEAQRTADKRDANVVSGGSGIRPGTAPTTIKNFDDAWLAAGGTLS